jgi:hypothetical protein
MHNLFTNTPKGSIMLWNVKNPSDLPKKKELNRLLSTSDLSYFKSQGQFKNYTNTLAKLTLILANKNNKQYFGYFEVTPTTDLIFTPNELESNSFFKVKFSQTCLGSYYVGNTEMNDLNHLVKKFMEVSSIRETIKKWPLKILEHREHIKQLNLTDSSIDQFDMAALEALTLTYGDQACDAAIAQLQIWHDTYFWKTKKPKAKSISPVISSAPIA